MQLIIKTKSLWNRNWKSWDAQKTSLFLGWAPFSEHRIPRIKKPVRFRRLDLHCGTNWYVQNIQVNRSQNFLQVLSLNMCSDGPYPWLHTSNWKGWSAQFANNINILGLRKQKGKRKFDEGNSWGLGYANQPTYKNNPWFKKKT